MLEAEATGRVPSIELPLEAGWTLPASWYSAAEVLETEWSEIFAATWQYAGPAELVHEPGRYFASEAGRIPVVVTRSREGRLHGLVNVCRHRGHLVAQGAQRRETLQCPYHAWTYELDGSLRRAPRAEREPGFDATELSLLPVATEIWGPFVFVNPDAGAAPLVETLGPLAELIAESGLDLGALRFHSHVEWTQDVNWKTALENYLECYHCPTAHPGFSKVIDVDPDVYRLSTEGLVLSQVGPVRATALEGAATYDPRGDVRQSQYHFIWPNTTINIAPGPHNLSIERWVPRGVARTIEVTDYFFGPDVSEARIDEVIAFDTRVAEEDVALVESVQRGLDSATVMQGRLMGASEQLIAAFQQRVANAIAT
jgi:phenylpropionate dioxygenase-like ring-hydroxylating dioxygenase large terminal subunit